jgi:DNA-directed RNA polymerase specialized sigma24 family protein
MNNVEPVYRVVVTREDDHWLADVPSLQGAHTFARTLPALDQAVREVVVLAADRPDEDMPALVLAFEYHTGDQVLDALAAEVRALREQAEVAKHAAVERTHDAAVQLVNEFGLSVRDAAAILGISPQRVSQLTAPRAS